MHQNAGDLAIDPSNQIPAVAARTRSGWIVLSDQAGSQPAPVAEPSDLVILDMGTPVAPASLSTLADGSVVTTAADNVFQKQHGQWWRLTATWTGECSAILEHDIAAASPTLRWAPSPSIRA